VERLADLVALFFDFFPVPDTLGSDCVLTTCFEYPLIAVPAAYPASRWSIALYRGAAQKIPAWSTQQAFALC
jgi:hypothetical protein